MNFTKNTNLKKNNLVNDYFDNDCFDPLIQLIGVSETTHTRHNAEDVVIDSININSVGCPR